MNNICIVTLYKSYNCGSYYQAYALGEYLKQKGYNVNYLKINYTIFSTLLTKLKPLKRLLVNGLKSYKKYKNEIKKFKKLQKKFKLISRSRVNKKCDVIILGSDTIWNFDSNNLYKKRNIFLGTFFKKKKIAYAVSVANTKLENYKKNKDIINDINKIENIAARDDYTKRELSSVTNKNVSVVCDPTMLIEKDIYLNNITERKIKEEYIYVYTFEDLDSIQIEKITSYAKNNNLKIVSGIKEYSWADIHMDNEPKSFINGIYYSKYVITDTFHGTIFSTIFRKNFIIINRNKNKVNDFVKKIKLKNIIVNNDIDLIEKITKKTEYNEKEINNYIKESKKYIENSIKE